MKKDFRLGFEKLENITLLSSAPWYVESIKADTVWNNINTSLSKPVVAIVDSGVDLTHPDLAPYLFHNNLDPIDGKDNDNNGLVDDYTGWDFSQYDNVPQDRFYHGTHLAGIVGVVSNNSVSILPIKSISDNGSGYIGSIVAGINYAVQLKNKGFNIVAINCSWGGVSSMPLSVSTAIKNASDAGIVVVIAAGNNGTNLDVTPLYPGSFSYSNSLTVGAINPDNSLAGYSNYGRSVTVDAPGTSIYSTLPGNSYGYVSGTSMATAVVSGAVGLLNRLGHYSATTIKNAIMNGCDMINGLADKALCGLVNLQKSMDWLKTQPQIPETVVKPPVVVTPPAPPVLSLSYKFDIISKTTISGWAKVLNSTTKPVVQIYINNVLRYSVSANLYRGDTKSSNGFKVSINRKFLNLRSNLLEIRVIDSVNQLNSVAYKGYIRR